MKREDLDRLNRLRESANDSARNFRTVYVSYLIIAFYILSIVMVREEELLFRNGSLQTAILNFSVPIKSFFIFSPLILLVLHFNLLIQAMFLSRKVHLYALAIQTIHSLQLRPSSNDGKVEMRDLLFPAPLAHMIAEGNSGRTRQNLLLVMIVFSSIILLPPLILIFIEIQFLVYQSKSITMWQSILVMTDIGILWLLWPRITAPDKTYIQWSYSLQQIKLIFVAMTMIFIFASSSISIWIDNIFDNYDWIKDNLDNKHKFVFYRSELVKERPPPEILSAYLDTRGEKRYDDAVIDPGTYVWCRYARPLDLKERAFKDIELSEAILCAVNFKNVILNSAELTESKLYGANFSSAKLHDASFVDAKLHGADLDGAELHGALLDGAELHGAYLTGAELHGAYLTGAELHGADLRGADLRGAVLRKAKFYGADLTKADLRGADLRGAQFYGAILAGANFDHVGMRIIDFSEPDDSSELYMQLKKTINNANILNKIQERMENAKNHWDTRIDPLSTKRYYIVLDNIYRKEFPTYLVDDLACKDQSSGYVAKGLARRALADGLLGPQLAENLLNAKCPAVANTLPEQLRADLEKITDR